MEERLAEHAIDVRRDDDGRGRARLGTGGAHAVDQLVQDRRERVQVAAEVALASLLLRGAIAGIFGRITGQLDLGRAEVEELDLVTGIDGDSSRSQRPVTDPGGDVGGFQDGCDPLAEGQGALPREATFLGVQAIEAAMGGRVLDHVRRIGCGRRDMLREREAGDPSGGGCSDDSGVFGPDVRRCCRAVE